MATATPAKPKTPPRIRYEDDLYSWVREQIGLLRAGRLTEIDTLRIAGELSDVGKELYRRLQSSIAVLCQHLLRWDYQPRKRSRSWALTVRTQRRNIEQLLRKNPGLTSKLVEALEVGYAYGRDGAINETGLPEGVFPRICPYEFEDMMSRSITFDPPLPRRKKRPMRTTK